MNWWTQLSMQVEPRFKIFEINVYYYGLIIGVAVALAIWICQKRAQKYKLTPEEVESMGLWVIIPGVLGARIYHVLDNIAYYALRPFDVVAIWNGGLAIYGALIGGAVGLLYAGHKKHFNILKLLDLAAPSIILAQGIGRWGNFFNQEAFGPPTDLPWKIYISPSHRVLPYMDSDYFHPLFLYESLWNLCAFIILILVERSKPASGTIFAGYLILYGVGRLLIESGRLDTATMLGFKLASVLSLIFIITGLSIILRGHLPPTLLKLRRK